MRRASRPRRSRLEPWPSTPGFVLLMRFCSSLASSSSASSVCFPLAAPCIRTRGCQVHRLLPEPSQDARVVVGPRQKQEPLHVRDEGARVLRGLDALYVAAPNSVLECRLDEAFDLVEDLPNAPPNLCVVRAHLG